VDRRDVDRGFVADSELVVAGGHGTVAFEPVDAAFDGVTLLVVLRAECWRAAAGAALVLAVADLVSLFRDRARYLAAAQVGAVGARAVGLVSQHPVRPGAGLARPQPGNGDAFQHGLELRAVTALPCGDQDRQ